METPGNVEQEQNSGYERLEQQIKWYDTKSASAQKWYKRLKLLEIIMAASIPALAHLFPTVTAILGAGIVVLEGIQHINNTDTSGHHIAQIVRLYAMKNMLTWENLDLMQN